MGNRHRHAGFLRNMLERMESTGGHMLYKLPGNISPTEYRSIQMGALALEKQSWELSDKLDKEKGGG